MCCHTEIEVVDPRSAVEKYVLKSACMPTERVYVSDKTGPQARYRLKQSRFISSLRTPRCFSPL